jgi:hypothetical protein
VVTKTLAIVALAAVACASCKDENNGASDAGSAPPADAAVAEKVCPHQPTTSSTSRALSFGDANADEHVDIADGVFIARSALSGGTGPACVGCVDVIGLGVANDTGNAAAVWNYLFSGTVISLPAPPADEVLRDPGTPPACAFVGFSLEKIGEVSDRSFTAHVTLSVKELERGAEAWSYGVRASGCAITSVTTENTEAAGEPPGLRTRGFERTDAIDGNATSAVVLSWRSPVSLPLGEAKKVAILRVEGAACGTCTLSIERGIRGRGQPVDVAVSVAGWSYPASTSALSVELCAP